MKCFLGAITYSFFCWFLTTKWSEQPPNPNQMRWKPFDIPEKDEVDWVEGLHTIAGNFIETRTQVAKVVSDDLQEQVTAKPGTGSRYTCTRVTAP